MSAKSDPLLIATAALEALLLPGPLDQDPPHRLGRGREEVPLIVPLLRGRLIDQPHICLVYQRRCLERLTRFFIGELCGRQFPQFVVDQRQQLLGGCGIALLDLATGCG